MKKSIVFGIVMFMISVAAAQGNARLIRSEAFDIAYDPSVWTDMNLDVGDVSGYSYVGLLRNDEGGMCLLMSTLKMGKSLQDYAISQLMQNRIFKNSSPTPLKREVLNGRLTTSCTFVQEGIKGKVWFFEEAGRQFTFIEMNNDTLTPARKVFATLKVHPVSDEMIPESNLIENINAIASLIKQGERVGDDVKQLLAAELDTTRKVLTQKYMIFLGEEGLQQLKERCKDEREYVTRWEYMSPYEQAALHYGYTLHIIMVDKNRNPIGEYSYDMKTYQRIHGKP